MIIAYVVSLIPFFVCGRFRLPLAPMLILFAAAGLAQFPRWLHESTPRQKALCASVALAALIFAHVPTGVSASGVRSVTYYNMGNALNGLGEQSEAIKYYRRSLELEPSFIPANNNLAVALVARGETEEAEKVFRRIIELDPAAKFAHLSLGIILRDRGEPKAGLVSFRHAVLIDPDFVGAHFALARTLSALGKWPEAERHYRRILEIDPSRDGVRRLLKAGPPKSGPTWGSRAPIQVNLTESVLSDIAENAVYSSYRLVPLTHLSVLSRAEGPRVSRIAPLAPI
jgi:tetratricopeptide (TPR) repeat protein